MIFSSIIWNAAYNQTEAILSDISSQYAISNIQHYDMQQEYPNFVRHIYQFDSIPEFRLNAKLAAMLKFPGSKIVNFDIAIPNPTTEFMPRKQRFTFVQAEQLKEYIRKKYSVIVVPYFFDIILHMTETDEERINLTEVLSKYSRYKINARNPKEK